MTAVGLTVRVASEGNLVAADASGRTMFEAPAPRMSDSSSTTTGAAGAAGPVVRVGRAGPGDRLEQAGRMRPVGVAAAPGELVLVPDPDLLTDRNTRYPMFIDPSWYGTRTAWTMVWRNYPTSSFWNEPGELPRVYRDVWMSSTVRL